MTLQAAIAELYEMEDNEIRDAMISLAKAGLIAPTGERRGGQIVWVATSQLNN